MTKGNRQIPAYDPQRDAAERWPGWTIAAADLQGIREVMSVDDQVILIDHHRPLRPAVAAAVAHLDLGHHVSDTWFDPDAEAAAACLAEIRLDPARSWDTEGA